MNTTKRSAVCSAWGASVQACIETAKRAAWAVTRWSWVLQSYCGGPVSSGHARKLTVIIPTYSPARVRNLPGLVRSLLRCEFVERVVVSNNNPEMRLGGRLKIQDPRLLLVEQPVRRGPGYSWVLALREASDYFMSVDDDFLIYPRQVKLLFDRLLERPEVPHGLAGLRGAKYVQCRETEVDTLYLVYAVTRAHVERYVEISQRVAESGLVPFETVELWGDDIVLSNTGATKPLIHAAGFLLQADSCFHRRVAIHKQPEFHGHRRRIVMALEQLTQRPETTSRDA